MVGQKQFPQTEDSMPPDHLNSLAYSDVLGNEEPSQPGNPEYMRRYRFWREVAGVDRE